jgi:hypothetical protein
MSLIQNLPLTSQNEKFTTLPELNIIKHER